jgi:hypothetical protein
MVQRWASSALEILRTTLGRASSHTLTIIANEGTHHLPEAFRRGMIYSASKGNLDFSSADKVREQFEGILSQLASLLKSRTWSRIYLVPFGHATLSMQIKLLVYRVTRLETIDIFYDGKGGYSDLQLELRPVILDSEQRSTEVPGSF